MPRLNHCLCGDGARRLENTNAIILELIHWLLSAPVLIYIVHATIRLIAESMSSNRRYLLRRISDLLIPNHTSAEKRGSMTLNYSSVFFKRWTIGKGGLYNVSFLFIFGFI